MVLAADSGKCTTGAGAGMPDGHEPKQDVDMTTASPARMYDYYLGGSRNYPVDREAAQKALSVVPQGQEVARANRRFLIRAVRYLAESGIDQYIDIGAGIPTSPNVHEVARSVIPDARVVYVDNDTGVTTQNREMLSGLDDGVRAIYGDIRYPLNIAYDQALREMIDFRRPVGVLFVAILHFLTNGDDPYNSVSAFTHRIAAGSHVAISHITSDGTSPEVISTIHQAYAHASAPAVFRTRKEIEVLFNGLVLVNPGIVEVSEWPNKSKRQNPSALRFLGGVGRKT
jgi:S-adenosyl methyltransferase